LHQVHRQFKVLRANQLRVSDLTYILTWQGLSMRPLIDMFVRRIVGWGVSNSMRTDIVLAVLEQALYAREPEYDNNLIHHSDTGSRYVSFATASVLPNKGNELIDDIAPSSS
jgi:transposase InsO family protein